MMKFALAVLAFVLSPVTAFAHTGLGGASGIAHGFMHPLAGFDHVAVMIAVGVMAALVGGRAMWHIPAAFMTMMTAGAVAGAAGLQLPFVEAGISVSIIALTLAMFIAKKMPAALAVILAGGFAVFHGFAHGSEMPVEASGLAYGLGFLAATALLHGLGIAATAALTARRTVAEPVIRS
jgi:urease accessory protein